MSLQGTSIAHFGFEPTSIQTTSDPETPGDTTLANSPEKFNGKSEAERGEEALEWAQVIELQEFSERKAWIEEKTRVRASHFVFPLHSL